MKTKTLFHKAALFMSVSAGLLASSGASAAAKWHDPEHAGMSVAERPNVSARPSKVHEVNSRYPEAAMQASAEGWAIIELDIDETGKPTNLELVETSNSKLFARHALKVVSRRTFEPATDEGKAIAVKDVRVRVRYKLLDS